MTVLAQRKDANLMPANGATGERALFAATGLFDGRHADHRDNIVPASEVNRQDAAEQSLAGGFSEGSRSSVTTQLAANLNQSRGAASLNRLARRSNSGPRAAAHSPLTYGVSQPGGAAQRCCDDRLNGNPRVEPQLQLQSSLDQSPRVAAQMKLAGILSRKAMTSLPHRKNALESRGTAQAKCPLAARPKPAIAEEEDLAQAKFETAQRNQGAGDPQTISLPLQREEGTDDEDSIQAKLDPVQREASAQSGVSPSQSVNRTGLPDDLKAGVESLSRHSMDDVRVHYNSPRPAQLKALAYAQGTNIHVAPGQQKHLPHEAWHVAQQKAGRVKPTMQLRGIGVNDDARLEHEADVMGRRAASFDLGSRAGSASSYEGMKSASSAGSGQATVQPVWGLLSGGLAGLVGGGYYGATGGAAVGSVIGGAVGSLFGPAGTVVGAGLLGGLGGLIGGVVGGVAGGVVSGLTGNAIETVVSNPPSTATTRRGLSIGEIVFKRAQALADKAHRTDRDAFIDFFEPGLQKVIRADLDNLKTNGDVHAAIERYYRERIAEPGQYTADTQYNQPLSDALLANPYIKMILSGDIYKEGAGGRDEREEKGTEPLDEPGTLVVPRTSPERLRDARVAFNKLVTRKLPAVAKIKRKLGPESAIGHEGDLHLGWASPRGAVLHELGHHLEQNLSPEEIATIHNFLRARARSANLRRVGYERLINKRQAETGYDIEGPDISGGGYRSLWGVTANTLLYLGGSEEGGRGIERFILGQGASPEISYGSQVYPQGLDTEYIATTIQFFGEPETAIELITKDPLRVSLFLYLAQPRQYEAVRKAFGSETGKDLNDLIHTLTSERQ